MPKPQLPSGTALACLSAALPTEEGPPTEFRIFPKGKFDTQKGDYVFDDAAAASVIAASQEWGNEYSLDYEHAVLANPPAPAPAAGWFGLEAREDGLWAVNVRWTDKAAAYLSAREYRYFSPLFTHNKEGRVTALVNIGLTNTPAIRRLEPLMPASVRTTIDSRENTVALKASFSEISDAVREAIRAKHNGDEDFVWVVEVFDDHAIFEKEDKLFSVTYSFDGAEATITGEAVEVRRAYVPVEAEAAEPDATSGIERAGPATVDVAALSELTGQASELEALAVVRAWKESASQVAALTTRIEELEAAAEAKEREGLIAQGLAERKLTPALKSWAGSQSVSALKAFLAAAPRIAALSAAPVKERAPEADKTQGQRWEDMRPIDKHNLAQSSPDVYAALKADFQARKKNPLA